MRETPGKGTAKEAAVSEVTGVVLLTGIVIIMLSALGVYVFSMEGPDDVPHTNAQEIMDISRDTIYIKHNGGEPVSTENLKIILNVNGKKYEYNSTQIYENLRNSTGNGNVWKIEDTIQINTTKTWGVNLKNNDEVELFLVDTPSNKLIQRCTLTSVRQKKPNLSLCLTPMGGITDTSISGKDATKKGYGDNWQVSATDSATDEYKIATNENKKCTSYYPPTGVINTNIYQEMDFGIKPAAYGIRPGDTFRNVTLIISYYTHDSTPANNKKNDCNIKFEYYYIDEYGQGKWEYYNETFPAHNSEFAYEYLNLTDRINTPEDLANFKVRIKASTTAAESSEKEINVDYIGLRIEEDNIYSE